MEGGERVGNLVDDEDDILDDVPLPTFVKKISRKLEVAEKSGFGMQR